jgi:hypothetical protein
VRLRHSESLQVLLLACITLALVQPAIAQVNSTIEGVVIDSSEAVVADATVTITNQATGVSHTSVSNHVGLFRVPALPGGIYRVEVEATGFRAWVLNDLVLEGAQVRSLSVPLEVGAQEETVEVRATAVAVETGRIATGAEIPAATIEQAPLPLRNVYRGLVAMVPGVTGTGGGGNDNYNPEATYGINAAGQKAQHNEYQMDGVQIANSSRGGETYFSPQPDMVEAVNVTASEFSAEKGRFSGARIQVFTKAGTNTYRGAFSEFYTNNRLQARTISQSALPEARRDEFGGTLGGPIVRDRTFFFVAAFGLRETTASSSTSTVETPEFRNFIISEYPNSIAAELFRRGTPLAEPSMNIETIGQHMARLPGRLAVPDTWARDMPLMGVAVVNQSIPRRGLQVSGRVDHHFANYKDRLTYSYLVQNRYTVSRPVRPQFSGNPRPAANSMHRVSWIRTFSPTLISETSFNWIKTAGGSFPHPAKDHVGGYFMETPGVNITGMGQVTPGFGAVWWGHNDFSVRQVFGWSRGAQNLRFGIDIDHQRDDDPFTGGYGRAQFVFANVLDFAQDYPFSQTGPVMDTRTGQTATGITQNIRMNYIAPFIQNTWRVNHSLTLNAGLRYDDFGHIGSVTNLGTPIPQFTYSAGQSIAEGSMQAIGGDKSRISADRIYGWSPRAGVGWDVFGDGKMAVRGGWGLYYNKLGSLAWIARINPPTWAEPSVTVQQANPLFSYSMGPNFQVPPSAVIEIDPYGGLVGQRVGVAGAAPGMRAPRTQSWMLSIQRTLGERWLFDASYNGNRSDRQWIATDINRFAGDLLDGTLDRLHPSFGVINQGQTYGRANGHLGTLMVQRRFSQGYSLRGMFNFGRAMDNFSTIASTGPGNPGNIADWNDIESQYSRANFDVSRRLAIEGLLALPSPWSTGIGGQVLGGWMLSAVAILQTGTPFDVFTNAVYPTGDFNADGFRYDFPNIPAFGTTIPGSPKRRDFINGVFVREDFPLPTADGVRGVQGTLPRNSYTGPGFANVNASLSKSFSLGREGMRLEFRADAFNLFNRVNLNAPQGNLTSAQFGRSTTSSGARQFMFGARVSF